MDLKTQSLPLARIKKIMKLDGDVKMISAEAPMLFSKAAEIFIHELTLRAWVHTEDNKRRTLQRNDIAMAITKYDQFDFLIDIVPRDELKQSKAQSDGAVRTSMNSDQVHYYFQLAQQQANQNAQNNGTTAQPIQIVQPTTGQIQTINIGTPVEQVYKQVICLSIDSSHAFTLSYNSLPYFLGKKLTQFGNWMFCIWISGEQYQYNPNCDCTKSSTNGRTTSHSTPTPTDASGSNRWHSDSPANGDTWRRDTTDTCNSFILSNFFFNNLLSNFV